MGGVHPSFMPQEALKHCDAVVIGEVELVIDKLLNDLKQGRCTEPINRRRCINGRDADARYDLLKKNRYVNRTFVQTFARLPSRLHVCAEPLMNGLKFRYRPSTR